MLVCDPLLSDSWVIANRLTNRNEFCMNDLCSDSHVSDDGQGRGVPAGGPFPEAEHTNDYDNDER